MVFSSPVFLFIFLPIVILGYYCLRDSLRNIWLLFASLVFYAWYKPGFLWILIFSVVVNYSGAMLIARVRNRFSEKSKLPTVLLVLTLAANLLLLFYFKYFNFTVKVLNVILKTGFTSDVFLPAGISFFTFQGISYVVDVYRKNTPPEKNFLRFATYLTMFPQLMSGPIVRYQSIREDLISRQIGLKNLTDGFSRFIVGLFRKLVIADSVAVIANAIFALDDVNRVPGIAWLGAVAYTLQIYFDFSGYSDMAIGLGTMLGFSFPENFNYPYISKSISEFWRRWHISLSSFFRDYVYIPLGGNRKHMLLNVAIVFLLTGIWHGAAYTFIAWGIWHGVFNILEKSFRKNGNERKQNLFVSILSHIYTLLVVMIGWVLFRSGGLHSAYGYLASMFGLVHGCQSIYTYSWFLDFWNVCVIVVAILWSTPIFAKIGNSIAKYTPENLVITAKYIGLLLMLALCILRIASGTYSAFIYFQF